MHLLGSEERKPGEICLEVGFQVLFPVRNLHYNWACLEHLGCAGMLCAQERDDGEMGQGLEQPGLLEGVPARGRGLE